MAERTETFRDPDNPFGLENPGILQLAPPEPRSVKETGLNIGLLTDLALRLLYYGGVVSGIELADRMRLPWAGVVDEILDFMVSEQWADLRGGKGFGRASVDFVLTTKGREAAREAVGRSSYTGPAPIPIDQYNSLTLSQSATGKMINRDRLAEAFSHLVIEDELLDRFGPAVNSSRSLFLYGPPGNGKTTIAETISSVLGGEVFVPWALEVDGQIIKVYDPLVHIEVSLEGDAEKMGTGIEMDRRWLLSRRPTVIVGGELTLETLDLIWNVDAKFYEAPFQVKANGGMLLIDDFGRQRVHPTDLLNRWIVPLEKHVDYLTLHTGKKFEVPFDELIVFSTNLDPKELVDEAFLRRIKYKIEITNPSEKAFREIFRRLCDHMGVPYNDSALDYIIDTYYTTTGMELRACHPRDILQLIADAARFRRKKAVLSQDLVDQACQSFFVVL
ncbi:MAG: ATP-binding protein [Deltaproteobacteria bacterium]|nr:ATP-binding protein [Deltaproteobacteria bacterium]